MTSVFGTPSKVLRNYISAYVPASIAGTSTTASLTVGQGECADSSFTVYITSTSNINWAVSNGNNANGYQGGTTLPNDSTIHFFIISGLSGVASFAHNGITPTLPSGYTYFRRIFSLRTDSTGALLPMGTSPREIEGCSLYCVYSTPILDVSTTALGTAASTYNLTIPQNIICEALFRANGGVPTQSTGILITSPFEADNAPAPYSSNGYSAIAGYDINGNNGTIATGKTWHKILTNTSGAIRARATTASTSLYLITIGYIDFRR